MMPLWLIILLALFALFCLFALVVVVRDTAVNTLTRYLLKHGEKAAGVITESEQYTGHGLHPADPCFKGKYVFTDHRGRQHSGTFSRYCFEPYDFAHTEYTFEDVGRAYGTGASIEVYYLRRLPTVNVEHIRLRK